MKITIETTEYKPVKTKHEYELPVEPVYYFITGERRSYMLKPVFYEKKLYSYEIISIALSFECKIENFDFKIVDIPTILTCKSSMDISANSIVNQLIKCPEYGKRTREQFMNDLVCAQNQINEITKL